MKINLNEIRCARWSGESTPKPAVIREDIPCPLRPDECEDALVEALAELAEARELLAKATEFRVGELIVSYCAETGRWIMDHRKDGLMHIVDGRNEWPTAAEAVAAAEKAKGKA